MPKESTVDKAYSEESMFKFNLLPTDSQMLAIMSFCKASSQAFRWIYDYYLDPATKNNGLRAPKYYMEVLRNSANDQYNKSMPEQLKTAIENFGSEIFEYMVAVAATEKMCTQSMPIKFDRERLWLSLNLQGKWSTFLSIRHNQRFIVQRQPNDIARINTKEFGSILIDRYSQETASALASLGSDYIYYYPQLVFNSNTTECYVRFFMAKYTRPFNGNVPKSSFDPFTRYYYYDRPHTFFKHHPVYLGWTD